MHWLITTHVRRCLRRYRHSGHVWQGRYRAFPIQKDDHLRTVIRYVERNFLRAGLVDCVEARPWSSLSVPRHGPTLDPGPVPRGPGWLAFVQAPMTEVEAEVVHLSIRRDRPFGADAWTRATAERLGLEFTLRPPGRPPIKKPSERLHESNGSVTAGRPQPAVC
jgi:putative transposase